MQWLFRFAPVVYHFPPLGSPGMDSAFVASIYAQARTHCPVARRVQMAREQSLLLGCDLEAGRALPTLLSRGPEATCDAWR